MIRIGLDGMGGDYAPSETVKGAVEAVAQLREEDVIYIFGNEDLIQAELDNCKYSGERIQVVGTTEVITNDDSPVKAVRRKKDSSMVVGLNYLKEEKVDVFIYRIFVTQGDDVKLLKNNALREETVVI